MSYRLQREKKRKKKTSQQLVEKETKCSNFCYFQQPFSLALFSREQWVCTENWGSNRDSSLTYTFPPASLEEQCLPLGFGTWGWMKAMQGDLGLKSVSGPECLINKSGWRKGGTHTNAVGGIRWFMLNLNNSQWLSNQQVFGFSLFTLQSTGPGTWLLRFTPAKHHKRKEKRGGRGNYKTCKAQSLTCNYLNL